MAVDMFLKLDLVPGESKDLKYPDTIEILSFSWGANQQGAYNTGTGGGAGKVHVQEPLFTHFVDKSSTVLFQMCANGKHIPKGEFIARRAGADGKQQVYYNLKFEDLIVSSVHLNGSHGGEDRMTESFALNFRKFEVVYTTQDNKGIPQPGNPVKWDMQQNAEA